MEYFKNRLIPKIGEETKLNSKNANNELNDCRKDYYIDEKKNTFTLYNCW